MCKIITFPVAHRTDSGRVEDWQRMREAAGRLETANNDCSKSAELFRRNAARLNAAVEHLERNALAYQRVLASLRAKVSAFGRTASALGLIMEDRR